MKEQVALICVDGCWTFLYDLDNWSHLRLQKKKSWVFFPKSNNDIYEKGFQGHNNDIMTIWEIDRQGIEMEDNSHGFHFYIVPATVLFKIDSPVYQDADLHPRSKTSK